MGVMLFTAERRGECDGENANAIKRRRFTNSPNSPDGKHKKTRHITNMLAGHDSPYCSPLYGEYIHTLTLLLLFWVVNLMVKTW